MNRNLNKMQRFEEGELKKKKKETTDTKAEVGMGCACEE